MSLTGNDAGSDQGQTRFVSAPDRSAAFAAGAPKLSRKVIISAIAAVLTLGVGGGFLERFLAHSGATTPSTHASVPTTVALQLPQLRAPLASFLGLVRDNRPAPPFSLSDASGQRISLSSLRNRVVVISFFDARCDDICPVVAAELRVAASHLANRAGVSFVTINVNPRATGLRAAALAGSRSGLAALSGWHFLTAPLTGLNSVWRAYGLSVDVLATTGALAHTDAIYLIDPAGRIRYRLTPFANESRSFHYSLASSSIVRFGDGIAGLVASLER